MTAVTALPQNRSLLERMYRARWLILELVRRDVRLRYRGSALGFAWTLLNPLLFMGIYVLVFGTYLRMGFHNYALFLLSGSLPFTWFSSAVQSGTTCIPDGRMYIGKTMFPPEVLVMVPVLSNLVNFCFSLPILLLADLVFHQTVGIALLLLPLLMAIQIAMTAGTVFLFATLNVFYRDFQQLAFYFVTALFYLTPIFYRVESVPAVYQPLIRSNPFAVLIMSYQDALFNNRLPGFGDLAFMAIFAVLALFLGHAIFDKYCESFGEYV